MKKLYYVANKEIGNYANEVIFFSSKRKLDAYIKEERVKGNIITTYLDSDDESVKCYWDIVYVN